MKGYFSKLLTEKERANQGPSVKWGRRLKYDPDSDYEDQPNRVPMSRHGWPLKNNNKSLTDVLAPLKGYLRTSVGRPWDEVYSELCKSLDRRSVSGLHVFSHLWHYVETNCWIGAKTGKVYAWDRHGLTEPDDFYVHPWTGILCQVPEWRSRYRYTIPEKKSDPLTGEVKIGDGKSYLKINGIWYYTEFTMVTLYKGLEPRSHPNYYRGKYTSLKAFEDRVIQKKRQLGRKELKKLKLWNTVVLNQVNG